MCDLPNQYKKRLLPKASSTNQYPAWNNDVKKWILKNGYWANKPALGTLFIYGGINDSLQPVTDRVRQQTILQLSSDSAKFSKDKTNTEFYISTIDNFFNLQTNDGGISQDSNELIIKSKKKIIIQSEFEKITIGDFDNFSNGIKLEISDNDEIVQILKNEDPQLYINALDKKYRIGDISGGSYVEIDAVTHTFSLVGLDYLIPANNVNLNVDCGKTIVPGEGVNASGEITCVQPFFGASYKRVLIYLSNFSGSATYTFPTPFTRTPVYLDPGMFMYDGSYIKIDPITITTNSITVSSFVPIEGFMIIEGF